MDISSTDWAIRVAAFLRVRQLQATRDQISAKDLAEGFTFNGSRLPLVNPQRGIFKPKEMETLLSIKTVFPKRGAKVWYEDQRQAHKQIYQGDETVDYAFMGTDPKAADNKWLKEAMEREVPIIYFLGISPGRYEAIFPVFIADWDASAAKAKVAFSVPNIKELPKPPVGADERKYALRLVKQRLHQASFREAVISAYRGRCALSGLPEPILLDAAHIIADVDEALGHPIVQNGIPLSKIHHAAFDAHLIGIDADYKVHVSDKLMDQKDGPMLEAIKSLNNAKLILPTRTQDQPDRERLESRFKQFKLAA
jgi:putative restriction endonuclease